MFVFTEPTSSGVSAGRPAPQTVPSADASIGSPTLVPVPCSSTYWTADGSTPARRYAARSTSRCAGSPGAVRLLGVSPSLPTALPRTTQ